MQTDASRRLRADAQDNHDRILEVAANLFATPGADASMRAIAATAGVGVGTLYRRFPTREQLIEATYRRETAALADSAETLLAVLEPRVALRKWMDDFIAYMAAKHGMGDALRAILTDDADRMQTRFLLADAIGSLVDAGAAGGTLRAGIRPYDVLLALGGVALITAEPAQEGEPDQGALAARLLDLLMDGLRP